MKCIVNYCYKIVLLKNIVQQKNVSFALKALILFLIAMWYYPGLYLLLCEIKYLKKDTFYLVLKEVYIVL